MSFDELGKKACDNGGTASETLPAPQASKDINISVTDTTPTLIADPNSRSREGKGYRNRADRLWSSRDGYLLRDMEDTNYAIKVANEHKKNLENADRSRQMRWLRYDLCHLKIIPLQMPDMRLWRLRFLPPSLMAVATSLSSLTGLDAQGIVYALLGAVSIATWGRVTIKLDEHWSEAAVNMLLQVSPSGTRKSALVRELRMPFDQFCAKVNEGHEDRMRQAQRERQLLGRAGSHLVRKELATMLRAVTSMDAEAVALIKATAREAAAFEQKLQSDCEIKESVRLLVDKATPFQLAATLQQQGECQGCITAEGSMLKSKLLSSGAVADLFLRGHTQEPYVYDNAKQRIALAYPALPMVNIVQPKVAVEFYASEALNAVGATPRFVPYFYSSTNEGGCVLREGVFDDYDDGDAQISASAAVYSKTIIRLLGIYHAQDNTAPRHQVPVEPRALAMIRDFEQKIRRNVIPSMPEAAIPCFLKAHGQAVRFAWSIHAWNHTIPHSLPITTEEMEQGIELVCETFKHIRYAYDPYGLQAYLHAQKILASLNNITERYEQDKLLDEGMDSSTIQRRTGLKAEVTNNALRLLSGHNYLAVYDDATANLKVVLHPYFFEDNRW